MVTKTWMHRGDKVTDRGDEVKDIGGLLVGQPHSGSGGGGGIDRYESKGACSLITTSEGRLFPRCYPPCSLITPPAPSSHLLPHHKGSLFPRRYPGCPRISHGPALLRTEQSPYELQRNSAQTKRPLLLPLLQAAGPLLHSSPPHPSTPPTHTDILPASSASLSFDVSSPLILGVVWGIRVGGQVGAVEGRRSERRLRHGGVGDGTSGGMGAGLEEWATEWSGCRW